MKGALAYGHDFHIKDIRDSAILTGSYVAGTVIDTKSNFNYCELLLDFTIGSLTSLEWKVEESDDNVTFHQQQTKSTVAGTTTHEPEEHTTTTTGELQYGFQVKARYIKISFSSTGNTTNSLLAAKVRLQNS